MKNLQRMTHLTKTNSFSPTIKNKGRMSAVTILVQHHMLGPSHCNELRKRNRRHTNWKGRNKTACIHNGHDYGENLKDSKKK